MDIHLVLYKRLLLLSCEHPAQGEGGGFTPPPPPQNKEQIIKFLWSWLKTGLMTVFRWDDDVPAVVLPAGAYRHRATGRGLPGRGVRLQAQGPHLSSLHRGQGLRYDHQRVLQVGAPHKPFMERFKLPISEQYKRTRTRYPALNLRYLYKIVGIFFALL